MDAAERRAIWHAWMDGQPPEVRETAGKCPPWRLYRHRPTGLKAVVLGYSEPPEDNPTGPIWLIINVLEGYAGDEPIERRIYDVPAEDLEVIDEGEP